MSAGNDTGFAQALKDAGANDYGNYDRPIAPNSRNAYPTKVGKLRPVTTANPGETT